LRLMFGVRWGGIGGRGRSRTCDLGFQLACKPHCIRPQKFAERKHSRRGNERLGFCYAPIVATAGFPRQVAVGGSGSFEHLQIYGLLHVIPLAFD